MLVLVGVGLALLLVAWIGATRPFSAPDETDHYLRALGIANGQLLGPREPWVDPALSRAALQWVNQDTRGVVVPVALSPPGRVCVNGHLETGTGSCVEPTHVGDYLPLSYLLPAVALAASHEARTGGWLARLASALPCVALILLALVLLWDGSAWSLLGLLAAIPPMVLFVDSVINPNGLEVAAGLACGAAVLRLARTPSRCPAWVWAALAVSAVVTVLSWQLGPVFVLADAALLAVVLSRQQLRDLYAVHRRSLRNVLLALLTSAVAYVTYGSIASLFHASIAVSPIRHGLYLGLDQLGGVLHQAVGVFGSLTIPLPTAGYWIWWALELVILAGALALGDRRDRAVLALVTVAGLAFPVVFFAWSYRYTGFPLQGRYVLPVLALIPLTAGEIVNRRRDQIPAALQRWLPAVAVAAIAAFQLFAWWIAARAAAGGMHRIRFWSAPLWSPPLGWWPWIGLAALGAGSMVAGAIASPNVGQDGRGEHRSLQPSPAWSQASRHGSVSRAVSSCPCHLAPPQSG